MYKVIPIKYLIMLKFVMSHAPTDHKASADTILITTNHTSQEGIIKVQIFY